MVTKKIVLTDRQKSIAVGLFLEDGYCRKEGSLQIEQSSKDHGPYVAWLHDDRQLGKISGKLTTNIKQTHPKTKVTYYSDRFYTGRHFKDWRTIWYEPSSETKYRKTIPENIEDLLDSLSLAIWFLDDGCAPGKLQITCFKPEDQVKLKTALENKFGLEVSLQKQGGNNQVSLYIKSKSYSKFYDIVSPVILSIPNMSKKLPAPQLVDRN